MGMEKHPLENGIKVLFYPVSHALSTTIGLYVKAGPCYETTANNGISHLLEHMHFRRLGEFTQNDLYELTDTMGTALEAATYKEFTRYSMKIRPSLAREAIQLFEKILAMNQWTEDDLQCEKRVVLSEIREKRRGSTMGQNLNTMLFGETAMSLPILGTEKTVQGISRADLLAYKAKHYCSPNIFFVVAGQCTPEDSAFLREALSKMDVPAGTAAQAKTIFADRKKPYVVLINDKSLAADIDICFEVDHPVSYEALMLLNSIVGGGTTSLLQKRVREEMGVTYDLYSEVDMYSSVSVFHITYSAKIEDVYRSLEAIAEILADITKGVTDNHMRRNLPFYTDNLWFWLEDSEILNEEIGWNSLYNREFEMEDMIERYAKTTKDDVKEVAEKIFACSKASILVTGATRKLREKKIKDIWERTLPAHPLP